MPQITQIYGEFVLKKNQSYPKLTLSMSKLWLVRTSLMLGLILFGATARAEMAIPIENISDTDLKALEINLQIYQIMLAIIGAVMAFFLTHTKEISKIFQKECACLKKIALAGCISTLIISASFFIWDYFTALHMLRNGGLSLDELIAEEFGIFPTVAGLILFIPSAFFVSWERR